MAGTALVPWRQAVTLVDGLAAAPHLGRWASYL